jgi:uncharacterized membrane protein YidH (DUF202 family)
MSRPRDLAAQPERTRLAWRRTALAATVTTLLAIRFALRDGLAPVPLAVVALLALTWLVLLAGSQRRIAALAAARPRPLRPPWPLLAAIAVVALAALAALTLAAALPPAS